MKIVIIILAILLYILIGSILAYKNVGILDKTSNSLPKRIFISTGIIVLYLPYYLVGFTIWVLIMALLSVWSLINLIFNK